MSNVRRKSKPKFSGSMDYFMVFTDEGFARLRTYLGNAERGQPKVYTAPFAKGDSMDKILSDWMETLVSIKAKEPSLWDFENDLAKKVGPLSVQLPLRERKDDIESYYVDILLPQVPVDARAIKAVEQEFQRLGGLDIRSQRNTVESMKMTSNSGSPFFCSKRRDVVEDTIPCTAYAFDNSPFPMGDQKGTHWDYMAVVGWRGQEGGPSEEDVKQRVVWMFPFAVNIEELRCYQPLIEGAQKLDLIPALVSMESVDRRITALFDTKAKDDLVICTDFSKFDQHFNPELQKVAKTLLTYFLTDTKPSRMWIKSVFPIKYKIPLVVGIRDDEGIRFMIGNHGMASGSGGTNMDETLVHRALQHEAAILHGQNLNLNSMCYGDDGILTYPGITVKDVVDVYESHGQECNTSKQYASTQDCVYLRRWHSTNYRVDGICVGVYSTCRALGRLRYLERFMDPQYWSPELVALRQLSIIENCKWHPLFHDFIEFCMKRDKYRLGLDLPGFLDNITQLAEEAIDHMKDFLGYTKTMQGDGVDGIASWEVVKYLKSKR